jgi:hypothetical protein
MNSYFNTELTCDIIDTPIQNISMIDQNISMNSYIHNELTCDIIDTPIQNISMIDQNISMIYQNISMNGQNISMIDKNISINETLYGYIDKDNYYLCKIIKAPLPNITFNTEMRIIHYDLTYILGYVIMVDFIRLLYKYRTMRLIFLSCLIVMLIVIMTILI